MLFHIVIPVFNRLPLTLKCLEGFASQVDQGIKIILVDDGSTDGTSDAVHAKYPQVEILNGNGNLFWSGSVNLGIRRALVDAGPDDYILLVNNDTFHEPDFIGSCREVVARHPRSLIGSVIMESPQNGVIKSGGSKINWFTAKYSGLNGGRDIGDFPSGHMEKVSTVTGRGVLVPVETYRDIGLYDERHFRQCGDTELPRRAYAKGYSLYVSYDLKTYDNCVDEFGSGARSHYYLEDLRWHFFDLRSHTHLKTRFWFAIKTATNPVQGLCFLISDFVRVAGHFLSRLRLGSPKKI